MTQTASIFLSLSIALLAGLLLSRLAKKVQLPAVTAYLIAGVLIGPFVLGSFGVPGIGITAEQLHGFALISDLALGFIAFAMGNEFRVSQLKKIGKQALVIGVFQALFTAIIVDVTLIGLHFLMLDHKNLIYQFQIFIFLCNESKPRPWKRYTKNHWQTQRDTF